MILWCRAPTRLLLLFKCFPAWLIIASGQVFSKPCLSAQTHTPSYKCIGTLQYGCGLCCMRKEPNMNLWQLDLQEKHWCTRAQLFQHSLHLRVCMFCFHWGYRPNTDIGHIHFSPLHSYTVYTHITNRIEITGN